MYEDEDAWINTIAAFAVGNMRNGVLDYDPKPLAALLRSNLPIPPGIRAQIADFLDPPEFPALNMKLVPKPIFTPRKEIEALHDIIAIGKYDKATAAAERKRKKISRESAEKARELATTAVKEWVAAVRKIAKFFGAPAPMAAHMPADPSAFYKRLSQTRKMLSYISGKNSSK